MSGKLYRAPAPQPDERRQRASDDGGVEEEVDWVEDSEEEEEEDVGAPSLSGHKRKEQPASDRQQLEQLMRRHAANNNNVRGTQPASGRLEPGGRLVFDDLRSEYRQTQSQGMGQLQQAYRPPYLEPLDNRELAELNDFFQRYSQRSQDLNKDNVWTFVRLVSGFTKQPLEVCARARGRAQPRVSRVLL